VARLGEGQALRAALGPDRPAAIQVLDGFPPGAGPALAASGLTPCLSSLPQIDAATAVAAATGRRLAVTLHVDTGMNRQGLSLAEAHALAQSSDRLRGLDVELVMSHLGSGSEPKNPRNTRQLSIFLEARALFPQARASLSASSGIFLSPDYRFDLVRPGVSLYGGGPRETRDPRIRAVATLTAPILDIRTVAPGEAIGYGEAVRVTAPTRLAVVAAGYTDGVFRSARAGGYAWFAGARRPLLVVNMDVLAIGIGDTPAAPGEAVELLGPNALLDDLAAASGSVAHEVLIRLSRRAERTYLGET
jgi:alanine racemase